MKGMAISGAREASVARRRRDSSSQCGAPEPTPRFQRPVGAVRAQKYPAGEELQSGQATKGTRRE